MIPDIPDIPTNTCMKAWAILYFSCNNMFFSTKKAPKPRDFSWLTKQILCRIIRKHEEHVFTFHDPLISQESLFNLSPNQSWPLVLGLITSEIYLSARKFFGKSFSHQSTASLGILHEAMPLPTLIRQQIGTELQHQAYTVLPRLER